MGRLAKNRVLGPLTQLVTENYFVTLVVMFSAISFTYMTKNNTIPDNLKMIMPWVLIFAIFAGNRSMRMWMVGLASVLLTINLAVNFYAAANHGFVIAYIGFALFLGLALDDETEGARITARTAAWFLTALMGLALIQKLASPFYMSGNLIGYYVMNGQIYENLMHLVYPDWSQIVFEYRQTTKEFNQISPSESLIIATVVPAGAATIIMLLTYASLIMQAGMELALLLRARLGIYVHYILLAFVFAIYSTRNENTFLSMNCILGYMMTTEETKSVRILYVIWVIFLLTMSLVGQRIQTFS